jgi:hypothetical protein
MRNASERQSTLYSTALQHHRHCFPYERWLHTPRRAIESITISTAVAEVDDVARRHWGHILVFLYFASFSALSASLENGRFGFHDDLMS